jgi:hypothetical protein
METSEHVVWSATTARCATTSGAVAHLRSGDYLAAEPLWQDLLWERQLRLEHVAAIAGPPDLGKSAFAYSIARQVDPGPFSTTMRCATTSRTVADFGDGAS